MEHVSQAGLRDLFSDVLIDDKTIKKTLEYHILSTLADASANLSIDDLLNQLDLTKVIKDAIQLLVDHSLIEESDGGYGLVLKTEISVLQSRDKSSNKQTQSDRSEQSEQIVASGPRTNGEEQQEEIEEKPEQVSPPIPRPNSQENQKQIEKKTEQVPSPIPRPNNQENQEQVKEKPDPEEIKAKLGKEKEKFGRFEESGGYRKKRTDIPDPSSDTGRRDRLRKEAFSSGGSTSPEESAQSDDLDMDSLFDDALGESIENFVSEFADLEIEETKEDSGIVQPLVDLLVEYGYLDQNSDPLQTPEYSVMQLILENYPIRSEQIETSLSGIDSLSLMLSNLKADDLIAQTNDYRYTISKKLYKILKDYVSDSKGKDQVDQDREFFEKYIDNQYNQFVQACYNLSYLNELGKSRGEYNKIPEFEVLSIVKDQGPISSEDVKYMVDETLPVVVSRMLSKLHADGLIDTDMDNNYSVTTKLYYYMVKDELANKLLEDEFEEYQAKYE